MNVIVGKNIGKSYFPWNNLREIIYRAIYSVHIYFSHKRIEYYRKIYQTAIDFPYILLNKKYFIGMYINLD